MAYLPNKNLMPQKQPPELNEHLSTGKSFFQKYPCRIRVDFHSHPHAQLLYTVAGVMWFESEGETLVVPPRRAVWVPSGSLHSIRTITGVEICSLHFINGEVEHLNMRGKVIYVNELLKELILSVTRHEAKKSRDQTYLDTTYELILLELKRAKSSTPIIMLPSARDLRLASFCRRLIDNPSIQITLEQHAVAIGVSGRTISRLFIKEFGIGFQSWRYVVQVVFALKCIEEGQTANTIARSLGYSRRSFAEIFKRISGISLTDILPDSSFEES